MLRFCGVDTADVVFRNGVILLCLQRVALERIGQ